MYGLFDETKRLVPEPILSHRLAHISLVCMRYLHRQDPQNPPMQDDLFAAWVMKSKRSPWLWRHRIRVTSIGRRQTTRDYDVPKYSFSQSLRRSHQMLYSKGIQSEEFYQERHIFYMWTLDLLYHTLHAAMKSEELTKALSKPFIPSVASILFPCRIKRVQKAVSAYFEKASLSACSDLRTLTNIYLYVDSLICRVWKPQEWSNLCGNAEHIVHNAMWFVTLSIPNRWEKFKDDTWTQLDIRYSSWTGRWWSNNWSKILMIDIVEQVAVVSGELRLWYGGAWS